MFSFVKSKCDFRWSSSTDLSRNFPASITSIRLPHKPTPERLISTFWLLLHLWVLPLTRLLQIWGCSPVWRFVPVPYVSLYSNRASATFLRKLKNLSSLPKLEVRLWRTSVIPCAQSAFAVFHVILWYFIKMHSWPPVFNGLSVHSTTGQSFAVQ